MFRKRHDHGSGRTAWFWRERYVDLLRRCNDKSRNWTLALPQFLADEKERATTRYVNITTIATFFSSVTATTLQMSISDSPSGLLNIVNCFWFLSLVFSVSSGVSSLLGMTWRKSSMWVNYRPGQMQLLKDQVRYDTINPPWPMKLWLDKAPMIFLIVSALMFIVGLNLFAYLSSQVRVPLVLRIVLLRTNRHVMYRCQRMRSRERMVSAYLS